MLETFTHATFAGRVGQGFRVTVEGQVEQDLVLIEARLLRGGWAKARREPFSLVFRGPRETNLSQGMRPMRHEEIGAFEIFLVPIAPEEDGLRYEAVFN
jgi:hypothetical protein